MGVLAGPGKDWFVSAHNQLRHLHGLMKVKRDEYRAQLQQEYIDFPETATDELQSAYDLLVERKKIPKLTATAPWHLVRIGNANPDGGEPIRIPFATGFPSPFNVYKEKEASEAKQELEGVDKDTYDKIQLRVWEWGCGPE